MSDDSYYSYDEDTGEIVAKTRFRGDGSVDRWEHINESGYSHYGYNTGKDFANDNKTEWSREYKDDPNREWDDRDGVL